MCFGFSGFNSTKLVSIFPQYLPLFCNITGHGRKRDLGRRYQTFYGKKWSYIISSVVLFGPKESNIKCSMLSYTMKNVQWKYEYVWKDASVQFRYWNAIWDKKLDVLSLYHGCCFKRACIYPKMILYFFTYSMLCYELLKKYLFFISFIFWEAFHYLFCSQIDLTYIPFVTIPQRNVSCLFLLSSLFYQDVMQFTKLIS